MLHLGMSEELVINGKNIRVYRDHQLENKFYYLPIETPYIARNGKSLDYTIMLDGEVAEITDDNAGLKEVEGWLNLAAQLGPSATEKLMLEQELKSKKGLDKIILSQPNYLDGSASINILATEKDGDKNTNISIVGTDKPAMYGNQQAAFAAKLTGTPAKLMYLALKEKRSHINVFYKFTALGFRPAYHVKITVDFKTVEDYWNHKIKLNSTVELGGKKDEKANKIATNADIDILVQNLIDEGAIKVEMKDFRDPQAKGDIQKDTKSDIALVKELVGSTLFNIAPLPSNAKNVLDKSSSTLPDSGEDKDDGGDGDEPGSSSTVSTSTPESGQNIDPIDPNKVNEGPASSGVSDDEKNAKKELMTDELEEEMAKDKKDEDEDNDQNINAKPEPDSLKKKQGEAEKDKKLSEQKGEADNIRPTNYNIKVGYTLRRRKITKQVKRVFEFSKAAASRFEIYPQDVLNLRDTDFDPTEQVKSYNTQDGPFKERSLEIKVNFDFEAYAIEEVVVHVEYGYAGSKGDKSRRLHYFSRRFTKDKTDVKLEFFVDEYGSLDYDYYVEFIHKANSIIGTHEIKIQSDKFIGETESVISVNLTEHSPLLPIDIQLGDIDFEDEGIRSVQLFLAQDKEASGRTVIFNNSKKEDQKFLLYPSIDENGMPTYYYKTDFFFQGDRLVNEVENHKDSQIVINATDTKIIKIAPLLANVGIIDKALVDVEYTDPDGDIKQTVLDISNTTDATSPKAFSVLGDEEDKIEWKGRTRFLLKEGRLLEGDWIMYDNTQPIINPNNSGFRVVSINTFGAATFGPNNAALMINVFDPINRDNTITNVLLLPDKTTGHVILEDIPENSSLTAEVNIYKKDGTSDIQEYMIPTSLSTLTLPIIDS